MAYAYGAVMTDFEDDIGIFDSLSSFRCAEWPTSKYYAGEEWVIKEDPTPWARGRCCLNIRKVLANYEQFVQQMQRSATESHRGPTSESESAAGNCVGHDGGCRPPISFDTDSWRWSGDLTLLNSSSGHLMYAGEGPKRVIFTPSRGRHDHDITPYPDDVMRSSCRVVLVPSDEHDLYRRSPAWQWKGRSLLLSYKTKQRQTVGLARHIILSLARFWRLGSFWMIDDSVCVDRIRQTTWDAYGQRTESSDEILGFQAVLRLVENHVDKATLLSIPSRKSLSKLKDRGSRVPQVNERAATAFVLVNVSKLGSDIDYDSRLPCKEDIVFSARVIDRGGDVVICRELNVEDKAFARGGCSGYRSTESWSPREYETRWCHPPGYYHDQHH